MSGVVTINTGRWLRSLLWRASLAFVTGALIVAALSVPAVLVPGTRTGATVAAALFSGALMARGRVVMSRVVVGGAMGLALALTMSASALLLVSDEPNAALWQVITREVVTHSMIAPLDEVIAPWLGGFEQMEEHLLLARFAVSTLVLGLAGGLLGGLLASGSARDSGETPGTDEGEIKRPSDGAEDVEESADGPHDVPPPEGEQVEEQPPTGVEDSEESADGSNDVPPPEGNDAEEQPRHGVEERRGVEKRRGRRGAFRRRIKRRKERDQYS